ncbi:MAG TPA: hypothetical protein DHV53_08875, partial [Gammaproteobacteria bacterium]|nr:hypothetical protein [Gammaproteobacteria bacterium]
MSNTINNYARELCPALLLIASLAVGALSHSAGANETYYQLDFSERQVQQVTIEARFSEVIGDTLDFHLPVWRS